VQFVSRRFARRAQAERGHDTPSHSLHRGARALRAWRTSPRRLGIAIHVSGSGGNLRRDAAAPRPSHGARARVWSLRAFPEEAPFAGVWQVRAAGDEGARHPDGARRARRRPRDERGADRQCLAGYCRARREPQGSCRGHSAGALRGSRRPTLHRERRRSREPPYRATRGSRRPWTGATVSRRRRCTPAPSVARHDERLRSRNAAGSPRDRPVLGAACAILLRSLDQSGDRASKSRRARVGFQGHQLGFSI
jgi:hypothetical protein